jgi:hypothetical protein
VNDSAEGGERLACDLNRFDLDQDHGQQSTIGAAVDSVVDHVAPSHRLP